MNDVTPRRYKLLTFHLKYMHFDNLTADGTSTDQELYNPVNYKHKYRENIKETSKTVCVCVAMWMCVYHGGAPPESAEEWGNTKS